MNHDRLLTTYFLYLWHFSIWPCPLIRSPIQSLTSFLYLTISSDPKSHPVTDIISLSDPVLWSEVPPSHWHHFSIWPCSPLIQSPIQSLTSFLQGCVPWTAWRQKRGVIRTHRRSRAFKLLNLKPYPQRLTILAVICSNYPTLGVRRLRPTYFCTLSDAYALATLVLTFVGQNSPNSGRMTGTLRS